MVDTMTEVFFSVVVFVPGDQLYTYKYCESLAKGTRVWVPFGRRQVMGVIWESHEGVPDWCPVGADEIRALFQVIDEAPCFSPVMLELARWMATYYLASLAEALKTISPVALENKPRRVYELTLKGLAEVTSHTPDGLMLKTAFKSRSSLSLGTLEKHQVPIKRLVKAGLLEVVYKTAVQRSMSTHQTEEDQEREAPRQLSPAQRVAFDAIVNHFDDASVRKPILLRGVTGAGKTEIYLQLISELFERKATCQVLVMVPEISLTPQTTAVFEKRFPSIVAVVHSGLTAKERIQRLNQVRSGVAQILIGPRSAVFAPFVDLRLIVVDEEHDSSYKQTSGLCYNGRDMAVLRGHLEGAAVLLGSATPSLESHYNVKSGKFFGVSLIERVNGRAMPEIEGVESQGGNIHQKLSKVRSGQELELPVQPQIIAEIEQNFRNGKQAIILVNRRGYSYFLWDPVKKEAVRCPHCSISMTTHSGSQMLRCHYCDYKVPTKAYVAANEGNLISVGYGSEQAEIFFRQKFPEARIARLDSDVVAKKELLETTLGSFRQGSIDILVGTQMLAKGHDFPNVTLTVLLEVDQLLSLPDFRAGERTFQLMVQASGRAGRHSDPGRVLVQSSRLNHQIVRAGLAQNYEGFAKEELAFRQAFGYPPFGRMITFEMNSQDKAALDRFTRRLEAWLDRAEEKGLLAGVKVLGPSVPGIELVRRRFRKTLSLASTNAGSLQRVGEQIRNEIAGDAKVKFLIDRDPQSCL